MRLYHRTTRANAQQALDSRTMASLENTGEAYFSTHPNGYASGYGDTCVIVDVPEDLARLDDEFEDGERHYAIKTSQLTPEYFIGLLDL